MEQTKRVDLAQIYNKVEIKLSKLTKKERLPFFERYQITSLQEISNNFGEKMVRVEGNIPVNLPITEGDSFLFISYDQSKYLHNIHKYPAKFFPELPRWLIEKYTKPDDIILDPFAGSGTVNLEALLHDRNSVAIDIEEFCRLLVKVKSTNLDTSVLLSYNSKIINNLLLFQPENIKPEYLLEFPYRDNWFKPFIINELAYIKQMIETLNSNSDYKDFYRVCFSSIIRSVSNADDNCTRTVVRKKLNKDIQPLMTMTKFIEAVLINTYKMKEFNEVTDQTKAKIEIPTTSDALHIQYPDSYFDCAITSPPYVNAVDYPRTHQLELYWLGFKNGSLNHLKKKHVGTEAVTSKDYNNIHHFGIASIDSILDEIYLLDPRRSYIAYKYLKDMEQNLREVFRVLKPDSHYIIVIGNNRIRNVVFESWKYILEISKMIGYEIETWFASEIIKHFIKVPREERINRDYIIVLHKRMESNE